MTWENDKNETATQIYSFIADFDEKIYANEERREDSLIQQAAHMQTAFSFVSAALFMVAAIIIDNRGRISLEFLLVAFSSISAVLLSSLFCATQAQKRYKRTSFPNARQLQRLIENQHGNFCSDAQRHKYVVKTYSEIHTSWMREQRECGEQTDAGQNYFVMSPYQVVLFRGLRYSAAKMWRR